MVSPTQNSATPAQEAWATREVHGTISPLLTKAETAKVLKVCHRTIENLLARKLLRRTKIGTAVRIDPADLQAYIDNAKIG